ncbi:sodium-coupled monocarboxylate transporter 1-like protein 1 [Leptotrombidium deliense]|uniref:Sodium-coupled monocarboxylate transporter 1-like protein 1 n=1 Tax=Leptotrombidium deliense TaxID=299467 RepID=A0A443SIS1_9ACAR|nr:sodium-coupled monocarboxylate transporter 1-like protein 1 [Leptotrombidium deliense]
MWCGNYCTTQTEVQRYCNVATKKKAKLAIYVNLVGVIAIISLACLAGIALYAYYDHCDPLKLELIKKSDQLMPFFVMETLSDYPGVPGLFVSCVFSASLSTLSSGFNALAAVTWDDFLSRTNVSKLSESQTKTLSKIVAASYGLLAIGMAFMVGQIGSVLQAAISLSGALVGPLFGVYLLGILCSFANATGVLIGLFSGEFFALWILVGSMLYPPSGIQMATYTDKCPLNFTATAIPVTSQLLVTEPIPTTEPMGLLKLYHIAFLLVPISGFLISASVGIIASLCTGGLNNVKNVNPKYMSILAFKLWPSSCVPNRKPEEENSGFTSGSQSKEHIYSHENLANNILADEKQEKNLGKTIENGYKNGHCINMEMANHNNRIKTTETENGYFTTF